MIDPPGTELPCCQSICIFGSPNHPSHHAPAGHCFSSSLLWNNSLCSIFFLLFHPIYFHFFPRVTLPLVSVQGSRVPVLVQQGTGKKGIQACILMSSDHYKITSGFGECDISGKEAADILQIVLVMDIPILHQARSREIWEIKRASKAGTSSSILWLPCR